MLATKIPQMLTAAFRYQQVLSQLKIIVIHSRIKNVKLANKMKMSYSSFFRKLKHNSFNHQEYIKLLTILKNSITTHLDHGSEELLLIDESINNYHKRIQSFYSYDKMPSEIVAFHLIQAFTNSEFWQRYFLQYMTVGVSSEFSANKAQTHSLAIRCKWLHEGRGCSYEKIWGELKRQQAYRTISIHPSLIDMKDMNTFKQSVIRHEFFEYPIVKKFRELSRQI